MSTARHAAPHVRDRDDVRDALVAGFRERIDAMRDEAIGALDVSRAHRLGARAAKAALAPVAWDSVIGGRYETADLVEMLGVSRQALAKRVAAGTLVGLPGRGTTLYPTWQFDTAYSPARVRPDVAALLAAWVEQAGSLDPYAVVSWSQTEQPEIHGLTPADALAKGDATYTDMLILSARVTAARLAQ